MYEYSQWTENSPGPLHCPDPCKENDPERSRGPWAKSSVKLLLSPTCVRHSGCGLWRCGAGPLWSYNQQEGFHVLGATCWTLLASFGAYSPEKVSHRRIKTLLSHLGFLRAKMRLGNDTQCAHMEAAAHSMQIQEQREWQRGKSSKDVIKLDVWWDTNQPSLCKERSSARKPLSESFMWLLIGTMARTVFASVCRKSTSKKEMTCMVLPRPMLCAKIHPNPLLVLNLSKDSTKLSYRNRIPPI